jgi:preprotein translocase subunit SecF
VIGVGFLGAGTLKDLALALFIGTAAGTYSSIFIATPVACQLQEQRPDMKALAARVAARRASGEGKRSARKSAAASGSTATAVVEEAEADLGDDIDDSAGVTRESLAGGGSSTSTGPRSQPKKNTTRSQRKKK